MGGIFAKPSVIQAETINSVINQSILKVASNTTSNVNVNLMIEALDGATVSNNQQSVDIKANLTSVLKATQNSDFNNKLKNEVVQDLQKKTVAVLGAFDGLTQNNNVNMITKTGNTIENLNLVELTPICVANNNISETISAKNKGTVVTGNSQSVKADFVQSCTTEVSSNMKAISDLANSINQKASIVSENPLNFLSDMTKTSMTAITLIIVAIVIGLIILIGPGQLDANALISQGMQAAKTATPQGRILTAAQMLQPNQPQYMEPQPQYIEPNQTQYIEPNQTQYVQPGQVQY